MANTARNMPCAGRSGNPALRQPTPRAPLPQRAAAGGGILPAAGTFSRG